MTEFLRAVKADLLDRRLLPILALLGVALVAALAYAVLGAGVSTPAAPAPTTATAPVASGSSGLAVSQAPASSEQSVAETTSGSSHQRSGLARNPFAPLAGATPARSTPSSTTTSSKSRSSTTSASSSTPTTSGAGSSSPGPGGAAPTSTPKPSSPAKPKTVYRVAVLFGSTAPGTPSQNAQLTPYENLKRQEPLPSSKQPLVVFRGVTADGKSATFTLVGEVILRGNATCLPSASQCQAIEEKPGQTEELEFLPPIGPAITYELQLVSITSSKASAATAGLGFGGQSKAGLELLRRIDRVALPGLRYSKVKGVLVLVAHPAHAARAHATTRAHAAASRPRPKR